jgi:1-acyl-sn-glycerol-3-phosphate acyltransferase
MPLSSRPAGPRSAAKRLHDRFNSPYQAVARFLAQRALLKPLIWSLTSVTVIRSEKLKEVKGGFVVIANHSSHLDTPLIVGSLPRPLARYLAAGAAADYFFNVWWRRGLTALFFNAFPVRRTGTETSSTSARSLLMRGIPVLIFPEGTRSKDGELGRFKPGAAALAAACDVPCIPVALIGAHIAHTRGGRIQGRLRRAHPPGDRAPERPAFGRHPRPTHPTPAEMTAVPATRKEYRSDRCSAHEVVGLGTGWRRVPSR